MNKSNYSCVWINNGTLFIEILIVSGKKIRQKGKETQLQLAAFVFLFSLFSINTLSD